MESLSQRLYPYIGGIIRSQKGVLLDINGVEDHVHLYLRWRPDECVSALMRAVKAGSSLWIHQSFPELASHGFRSLTRPAPVATSDRPRWGREAASPCSRRRHVPLVEVEPPTPPSAP